MAFLHLLEKSLLPEPSAWQSQLLPRPQPCPLSLHPGVVVPEAWGQSRFAPQLLPSLLCPPSPPLAEVWPPGPGAAMEGGAERGGTRMGGD